MGAATSDHQVQLSSRLLPILTAIRDEIDREQGTPSTPDKTGEGLKSAALAAFKGMSWGDLEAHSRDQ